jgi:anti-sigma B factor antagonist
MSTELTFDRARTADGELVLRAAGEIDMSNASRFAEALAEAAADGRFTLDLTRVDYLDSAGLAALFPHVDEVRLLAGPVLGPVLTIAGLADVTTIRES